MTKTAVTADIPTTTRAAYQEQIKKARNEKALTEARTARDVLVKRVAEGTEVLQKMRTLHLDVAGKEGADNLTSAIENLEYNLRNYTSSSLKSAERTVANLEGDSPVEDEGREF